jgi:hypothetical protein
MHATRCFMGIGLCENAAFTLECRRPRWIGAFPVMSHQITSKLAAKSAPPKVRIDSQCVASTVTLPGGACRISGLQKTLAVGTATGVDGAQEWRRINAFKTAVHRVDSLAALSQGGDGHHTVTLTGVARGPPLAVFSGSRPPRCWWARPS